GFRTVARVVAETGMPQWLARDRVIGHEVAAPVIAEEKLAGGAEQAHRPASPAPGARGQGSAPNDLARLVVDGLELGAEVSHVALGGRPALGTRVGVGQVEEAEAAGG